MRPRSVSDEEILDAAQACLLAEGPSVAVATIGERVGISGPAVLKRFGTKANLVTRALLAEPPPDLSRGPTDGPLRPQLVAMLLSIERLVRQVAPRLATLRAGGVGASRWLQSRPPQAARRGLLTWLEQARCSHGLEHADLETVADLLIAQAEARGFLAWIEPAWIEAGDEWARRAVDALFDHATPARPKRRPPRRVAVAPRRGPARSRT